MATTFVEYTGDGNATKQFTFPSLQESDVKVRVDGVLKTTSTHYNITNYTTTGGGNVVFTSGNIPPSGTNIRIFRDTNVDTAKATFTAGSSVKAADLNNNTTQLLYRAQEEQLPQQIHFYDIDDGAIIESKISASSVTTVKLGDDAVTTSKLADDAVTTAKITDANVTTAKLAADSVTGAKIADDQINSEHYVDGSIDTAHIADAQITTAKVADGAITSAKLASGTVATGDLADGLVSTAKLAADSVTNAKIADDSIDSEHYVDGSIDTAHIGNSQVTTAKIAADAVDGSKIADDSINSEHYVDGSIDTAHIADSQITSAKIASNAVTTDKIADGELTTLAGMQSTTASNLASSTALTATTAELNQLDGITLETSVTTNSDTRIPTSKAVNDLVLSVTNALGGFVAIADETSFPTSNPDPSNGAGTVVSISQVSSGSAISINSSGVATIANGAGTGNTVTITGFPTTLRNTSLAASSGLQVQTTTTLHTYTFHKQLASAADIAAISATVNSFSNRYRVSSSAPTSSLDGGDLWYDTTNSKLMVYSSSNSAWEEATAIGNFFISTISSSSNTGGGSATPNGTAYRFTISDAPTNAAQLIVSVDGVIQKPNSGSSQPSEGFVLVGNDIIFGAAPANGASLFVTVIGSTVGIGTPSNNTVTTAILQNGSVTTAKITDANVTTAKIADDAVTAAKLANTSVTAGTYGSSTSIPSITVDSQGRITAASGNTVNTDLLADTSPQLGGDLDTNDFNIKYDNQHGPILGNNGDGLLYHTGSSLHLLNSAGSLNLNCDTVHLRSENNAETYLKGVKDGAVEIRYNNNKKFETTNTGVTITGSLSVNGFNLDDNEIGNFGGGNDLKLYHDGGNGSVQNVTGALYLRSADVRITNSAVTEHMAKFFENGAVELYHDNSKKFETTSAGATLTGNLTTTSSITIENANHLFLADNGKARFGASQDLEIYHSGSHSVIKNSTGYLQLLTDQFAVNNNANNENIISALADGAVNLYYDNSKKFETTSSGATVTGSLTATDHVYVGHNDYLYFTSTAGYSPRIGNADGSTGQNMTFHTNNTMRMMLQNDGHLRPASNNTYDLGTSSDRWRNIYTQDLQLSNEAVGDNGIDGTWGNYTIVEGESDLFLKNNRSGKTYKFNLTEVS